MPKDIFPDDTRVDAAASDGAESRFWIDRRRFLYMTGWLIGAGLAPGLAFGAHGPASATKSSGSSGFDPGHVSETPAFPARDKVPDPRRITFSVQYPGKAPIKLKGHYWYNRDTVKAGIKCPAIVELNPYRCRDGMMTGDSGWYPWFAYHDYLCFRIDLQGSGDSGGILSDEYTNEEIAYCMQVIEQIAAHPYCDGNVGMMGESWSAINMLMVSAHKDCPSALKAGLVICGSDDRYNDDIHYIDGAMMQDNFGWPSSMWGWICLPPDPLVAGSKWSEMWRRRIRSAEFWFKYWGRRQARDRYWYASSVRDRYRDVKVPIYIVSGYQDGYKNPVLRAVTGLSAAGKPVQGLLGPWGHSTPNDGYPGPRMDWMPYVLTHWWDKWLKGKAPDPETELPEMTVWLGESREPNTFPCDLEQGKWAAEDGKWADRVKEKILYLRQDSRLSTLTPVRSARCVGSDRLIIETNMLETSSWGRSGNDDLPGDQSTADSESLHFDTAAIQKDIDCFGRPTAHLTLSCDQPIASIAVRLCEVSPETKASHLVCYRFFNLAMRGGDAEHPEPVTPGEIFHVSVPLNVIGHTFKRGWRVRLSVSSSFFPTMWAGAQTPVITLYTGPLEGVPMSALSLPLRRTRAQDARLKTLLPENPQVTWVDSETYVPTTTSREGSNSRKAKRISFLGMEAMLVKKSTDYGRCCYGGPLRNIWVDQTSTENYLVVRDFPQTLIGYTSSKSIMERTVDGSLWKIMCKTTTRVWTERESSGSYGFRYKAKIRTFVGDEEGRFEPFENRTVEGSIPRAWV